MQLLRELSIVRNDELEATNYFSPFLANRKNSN